MHEIELKLEVDPGDLPLVRQQAVLAKTPSRSAHQITIYYDTPETKLKKNGLTLRVRSVGDRFIQTIKATSAAVGLFSREEIEQEVFSLEPELGFLQQHPVHALLADGGAERLEALIISDVQRTSWLVENRTEQMQVDLDHGTITSGEHAHEFAELEFELRKGTPAGLIHAARRLADHVPVRIGVLSKAERGFMVRNGSFGKVSKAAPIAIQPDMTIAHAFELIVHGCLKHYRLNEELVCRGRLANALHQSRVAMRRLRSAFTLFRPAVEDVEFQHLRDELRWFTEQLGEARNLDVYLERELGEAVRMKLTAKRERAYDEIADAMNSHRLRRLLIDIVGWTAVGAWRKGRVGARPVKRFATKRLTKLWTSIEARGRDLAALDEESRHRVRIQAKKLRYGLEFLHGLYPEAANEQQRFASAIEEVQESLGKLNDMATAKKMSEKAPLEPSWLIGSFEERSHLFAVMRAMRELLAVGPFWSSAPTKPAAPTSASLS